MSFRIMARHSGAFTGIAKPTAVEALQTVHELLGDGFDLTAIIDDDGDVVPVGKLEELAASEVSPASQDLNQSLLRMRLKVRTALGDQRATTFATGFRVRSQATIALRSSDFIDCQ